MSSDANGAAWPQGYGRIVLDRADSTMSEAARRADELAGPTWIMARVQDAGRGRRGRAWAMPAGNFAATLVMRPAEALPVAALRSFVAALALFDALVSVTGRAEPFALKWPNDVLLNGGKLAGILLESLGQGGAGGQAGHLAIGFGVNLAAAPDAGALEPGAVHPVALAAETGARVDPESFLAALASAWAAREAAFTTWGFAPIREAWLARAARLGQRITARLPGEDVTGTFETVDNSGALVLKTARGRRAIQAADVYF